MDKKYGIMFFNKYIYIYLIVQENKKLQGGKSKAAFSLPQM